MADALTQAQRLDRFARALSSDTGLTYDASYKWASAEVGPLNNLGVMLGPSTPAGFATPELGAAAAADVIMHRNNYAAESTYSGIRASIASGDTTKQLTAIASSPWHLTPPAGQLDPYYARVFGLSGAAGNMPTVNAYSGAVTGQEKVPPTPLPSDALGRAQIYVANLTAAQSRGVTTDSSGKSVASELARYQGIVSTLSHPAAPVAVGVAMTPTSAGMSLSAGNTAQPASLAAPSQSSVPTQGAAPAPAAASAATSSPTFDPTGTLVLIAAGVVGVLLLTHRGT